jgi:hypothetical protein
MKLGARCSALAWGFLTSPACGVAFMTATVIVGLVASYAIHGALR